MMLDFFEKIAQNESEQGIYFGFIYFNKLKSTLIFRIQEFHMLQFLNNLPFDKRVLQTTCQPNYNLKFHASPYYLFNVRMCLPIFAIHNKNTLCKPIFNLVLPKQSILPPKQAFCVENIFAEKDGK